MDELIDKPQYIIVGSGIYGSIIAEKISNELNVKVLIIEKKSHIGSNYYDYIDKDTGILISKYGPNFFHTNNKKIWDYVQKFDTWKYWEHKVLAKVDNKYINIPINVKTINDLCGNIINDFSELNDWIDKTQIKYDTITNSEESAKSKFGEEIYEKIIKNYTYKRWKKYPNELNKAILDKFPFKKNNDISYFTDKFQALPTKGYTHFFERLLKSKNIKISLNTDFFNFKKKYNLDGVKIIYTDLIDEYFSIYDKLEYIGIEYDIKRYMNHSEKYFQENSIINYPEYDVPYSRTVEYKHLLNQSSSHTIIIKETATISGEPLYPILTEKNIKLYEKYKKLAEEEKNVFFIGRLTNYNYLETDEMISDALNYFKSKIKPNHIDSPIVEKDKNYVIICRYKENLDWVDNIVNGNYIDKIIIYNKGLPIIKKHKNIKIIQSLNIGREGGAYLDYIINNFNNLPDNIWFLQGDPVCHNPSIIELFKDENIEKYINNDLQTLTTRYIENIPPKDFYEDNNIYNISDNAKVIKYFINKNDMQLEGHSYFFDNGHQKIYDKFKGKYKTNNITDYLCKFIDISPPKNNIIEYLWSACFFVKKKEISKYNINVFKKLRKFLYETDNQGSFQGYILERFWGFLFSNKSWRKIYDCYKNNINGEENPFLISFDSKNKKLNISNSNCIKIEENSTLIIKKNNKLYKLPTLGFLENTLSIHCPDIKTAYEYHEWKTWERPLSIILRGHIRNAFSNNLLKIFIGNVLKINKDINIFIHTWDESEAKISWRKLNRKNIKRVNETVIRNYFGEKQNDPINESRIDKDTKMELFGNIRGKVGGIPKIAWKLMWAGKYKIFNYIYTQKWPYILNLRFDLFNIRQSWKMGINVKSATLFVSTLLTNKNDKIIFFKNKPMEGIDNIYFGHTSKMHELASKFHKNLDNTVIPYINIHKQEKIVYLVANNVVTTNNS